MLNTCPDSDPLSKLISAIDLFKRSFTLHSILLNFKGIQRKNILVDQFKNMPNPPLQACINVILISVSYQYIQTNSFWIISCTFIFCPFVCFLLREKANLAVTISTAKNEVLAYAAFVDHPIGDLVDQASWEQLLQTHFNATKFTVGKMMHLIWFNKDKTFCGDLSHAQGFLFFCFLISVAFKHNFPASICGPGRLFYFQCYRDYQVKIENVIQYFR